MKQQINDNTYFSIQAWMVTKLKLKGAERDVYAIIYGYSQDNDSDFHGSLDYISQLTGYSRNAICTALKSLTDSGLITKTEKIINNIKYCKYHTSSLYSVQVACMENEKSVQVACINNNKLNNKLNNNISKDIVEKSKTKKPSLYDKCVQCIMDFTDDSILQSLLEDCLKMFLTNSRESGIPFYTNNFKGKLNKLKSLSTDNYIQRDIVKQTIDNGWNGFYELKNNKKNNTGDARTNIERLSTKPVPRLTDEEIKERNRRIENGELEQF